MAYKIKSLIYFLGLLVAMLLYYATEQNPDQLDQQMERPLAENDNPTKDLLELK